MGVTKLFIGKDDHDQTTMIHSFHALVATPMCKH